MALPIVLGALALIAIITAVIFVSQNQGSSATTSGTYAMTEKDGADITAQPEGSAVEKSGEVMMGEEKSDVMMDKPAPTGYLTYSNQVYEDAVGQKRVFFFHAAWCPTCRVANQELTASANLIPSDVAVFKTDYDTESALKSKYGVTYQHTFVQVDTQGNAIAKWNGGGIDEILMNLK